MLEVIQEEQGIKLLIQSTVFYWESLIDLPKVISRHLC